MPDRPFRHENPNGGVSFDVKRIIETLITSLVTAGIATIGTTIITTESVRAQVDRLVRSDDAKTEELRLHTREIGDMQAQVATAIVKQTSLTEQVIQLNAEMNRRVARLEDRVFK